MKEISVTFENEGQKIEGILNIPNISNPSCIIMVHGFGGYAFDEPFRNVAENLCNNGFEVLRFAFRGYEGSELRNDFTISGEISDLRTAIDFIEKQKINKIGLMTESLGGSIAILLNDPRIHTMFLMAPPIYLKDTLYKVKNLVNVGEKFWEEIDKINTIEKSQIRAVKCPIMIVHGSNDIDVNHKQSEELFKIANNPKDFVMLEKGEHVLTRNSYSRKKIIELSLGWFQKWLK